MDDFGLTEKQATHQYGDQFESEEHAALAWSMTYVPASVSRREEFISLIYSTPNGKYTFTAPETSSEQGMPPNQAKVPDYGTLSVQAIIHSHPFYVKGAEGDQKISNDDKAVADSYKTKMYVGNAMGQVLLYNPHNKLFKNKTITNDLKQYPLY